MQWKSYVSAYLSNLSNSLSLLSIIANKKYYSISFSVNKSAGNEENKFFNLKLKTVFKIFFLLQSLEFQIRFVKMNSEKILNLENCQFISV